VELDIHQIDAHFELLKDAGVPKAYRLWTLGGSSIADPREPVIRDSENLAAQQVCDAHTSEGWLVLAGDVGTGKTTFATATFNDMVAKRVRRNTQYGSKRPPKWLTEAKFLRGAGLAGSAGYHGRAAFVGTLSAPSLCSMTWEVSAFHLPTGEPEQSGTSWTSGTPTCDRPS